MNERLHNLIVNNWQTTLSGVVAGAMIILESNGGTFNATGYDWIKAIAITALGLYAKVPTKQ
jgi:hypothetical protein